MKHLFQTITALVIVFAMTGSAVGQECVPLEPKETSGPLVFAHSGESLAVSYFLQSGCNWNGATQFNGTDGLVLETTGMEGATGSVTGAIVQGRSLVRVTYKGYFLDDKCQKVANSDISFNASLTDAPEAETLTIPATAKWFVVGSVDAPYATNDTTITLKSDGRDCVVVKKKKKRRRR